MTTVEQTNKTCSICGAAYYEKSVQLGTAMKYFDIPTCKCEEKKRDQDERKVKIDLLIHDSGIPDAFKKENMKDWIKVKGTEQMTDIVREYLKNLEENVKLGKGIFLAGSQGRGKTKISCFVGLEIMRRLLKKVYYLSITQFLYSIDVKRRNDIDNLMKKYTGVGVLILDDIGESKIEDWLIKYLYILLDSRNRPGMVTIINSMRPMEELKELIQPHNLSRIMEMAGKNIAEISSTKDMRCHRNKEENDA